MSPSGYAPARGSGSGHDFAGVWRVRSALWIFLFFSGSVSRKVTRGQLCVIYADALRDI